MSNWSHGTSTHTPIVPGRKREPGINLWACLALGLAGWLLIGIAAWGAYVLLKDIVEDLL